MLRDKIYLFGIILLVVGLSFSRAFVSISYVILIGTWLIDLQVFKKFGSFFKNKAALLIASIYIMHLIGLLYTSDFKYAWLETRTKVPILILPLIFSTMRPLSKKNFTNILIIFNLSVVGSFYTALYWLYIESPLDFREAFHFVSHIRLSLMAVIAIGIFGWLTFSKELRTPAWAKVFYILLSVFLLGAINVLEVMSGVLVLLLTVFILGLFYAFRKKNLLGNIIKIALPVSFLIVGFVFYLVIKNYMVGSSIPVKNYTAKGNPYLQLDDQFPIESGSPIGRNICWDEMRTQWNQRSVIPFDSVNENGNLIKFTVLRYLNSLHLDKDAAGIDQLTSTDIQHIESGFANVEYTKKLSIKKRIYKLLWEYDIYKAGGNINSSSALKRFYLWQNGLELIKQNMAFGVGTGDVKSEFAIMLIQKKSPLSDSGLRAHNQWISIAIAFGLVGFFWFAFAWFYPVFKLQNKHFLLLSFFTIYTLSMFWEDSLETQIGVTIFAFFYPFFLFLNPFQKKIS